MLLKLVILVALVILTFGYSYSFLLLDIYGGANLTSGDGKIISQGLCNNRCLSQVIGYCVHIVCMYCFLL